MCVRFKGVVVVLGEHPSGGGETPAMQRVANRTIACHALESLAAAGVDELAVVAPRSSLPELRSRLEQDLTGDIEPVYLPLGGRADLVGALRGSLDFVGADTSIVHLGDGLVGQSFDQVIDLLGAESADMTLLLHRDGNGRDGLGPSVERLLGVRELGDARSRLALTGVCMFGPGMLRRVTDEAGDLGPDAGLVEIADLLAGAGCTFEAGVVPSWRRYRGDPVDLLELNRLVLDGQRPEIETLHRGADNRIEGRVIIDHSAEVSSSVILGPCIIGAHARVADSYIGPYTSIGPGAEIEGAEIVSSIVSDGVRIRHISGRIEGSTIGCRSSIFRDFSLPRAMRLHVGEDVEVALQ